MSESPILGLRIDRELLAQIDGLVGSSGKNRSEVALNLIKKGLGITPEPDTEAILERLAVMEKKLLAC